MSWLSFFLYPIYSLLSSRLLFSSLSFPHATFLLRTTWLPLYPILNSSSTHQIDPPLHRIEQAVLAEECRGAVPVHGTRGRFHEGALSSHTHTQTHAHTHTHTHTGTGTRTHTHTETHTHTHTHAHTHTHTQTHLCRHSERHLLNIWWMFWYVLHLHKSLSFVFWISYHSTSSFPTPSMIKLN